MHVVLWDIDGTLIRGGGMGSLALHRTYEEVFGVTAVGKSELRAIPFNGRTDPAILADLTAVLGIDAEHYHSREPEFRETYLRHLRATVAESKDKHVLPGVLATLDALHHRSDVSQGLLTGNIEAGARIKLEPFELNPFFAYGGFGDDGVDRRDLAARAGERAREHVNREVPPERILVIGDTVHDVSAAKTHGYATAAVATGGVTVDELRTSQPDGLFLDLGDDHGFRDWLEQRLA